VRSIVPKFVLIITENKIRHFSLKLTKDFYTRNDVVAIAQELLGKKLLTKINGKITSGIIVETEAYRGWGDKACHANENRKTKRTEIFYEEGGVAYVYLCYGIHHLFNIITNEKDKADAVLIRAIEPVEGMDVILKRRNFTHTKYNLTAGPGALSQALGITTNHYGMDLQGTKIWLEEHANISSKKIIASPRVGVGYAGNDALLPWRFRIKDNLWTSRAK
jgi:DNA-3-methyladenine glycosylase